MDEVQAWCRGRRIASGATAFALLLFLGALIAGDARAQSQGGAPLEHRVAAGFGIFTPFDREHREVFGSGPELSMEYSIRISKHDAWLGIEAGWVHGSGDPIPHDPTFETEASYDVIPISVGVRTAGAASDRRARVYLGIAGQWLFTRYHGPFGGKESGTTMALVVEFRPEIDIGSRLLLWLREQVRISAATTYGELNQEVSYGGAVFQAGLGWRF